MLETASPLLEGLNAQQREAVLTTEGPVLILAGAGSGKTRVITHRIAHLVLEKGVPSDRILAVTFTNKAAGEMKSRVERLLEGGVLGSWISTFHALCVRILRRDAAAAGLPRDFLIYDEADQMSAVREALRALDLSEKLHPPRRVLSRISAHKNSGASEASEEDSFASATVGRIAERYRKALLSAHALDFDDLLLCTRSLLAENEAVREAYRRRFSYILVDEYQDTNRVQYEIIRHLSGPNGNLTVVGDEDQSIYSWRGADIQNILDFEADFPGARVLRLEENYRSSQAILDAASGLVACNLRRKGKTLRAVKASGEPVRLHRAGDEYQEAAWVVERIASQRSSGRAAILFRMNAQSRLFEEALMRVRIPYIVVGGVGFYERKEVKDLLSYLRLALNPRDAVSLRRILNVPPRGIGDRTVNELARVAGERGVSLGEALEVVVDDALLPARATQPLRRFRELMEEIRQDVGRLPVKTLLERILARTGYSAALAQEDSQESQSRLENLAELLSAAAEHDLRSEGAGLPEFLDQVSLLSDVDQAKDGAPVVLLTFHSAKGLEFDSVFLVGMEEGLVPHARSLAHPDSLEEERRLCYVGMTRAMDRLHLTHVQSRQVFGQRRLAEPSRFLAEIPRERVLVTGEGGGSSLPLFRREDPGGAGRESRSPSLGASLPGPDLSELRPGVRVRHPLFGVGTILRCDGSGAELKLTVSFAGVGAKRLVARFAGLETL